MTETQSDAELLAAWAEGDRRSGAALLRRHFDALYRFFTNKVAAEAEAEDLVQQTMAACVEARGRYRGDASFRTFLFAIARNVLLKHIRDRKQVESIDAEGQSLADHGLGMSTALGLRREQQLLLTALRHVSIDSQVLLELYYWEELSGSAIAQIVNMPENTVRSRIRKGKELLERQMRVLALNNEELQSTLADLETWVRSIHASATKQPVS